MNLRLDWCSYEAAEYACTRWHYSKCLPRGRLVKIGVWEDDKFIGAIIFSMGANNHIGSPYGLEQTKVCELTRIALSAHRSSVSRIGAISLKMIKQQSPGIRLIVSYADPLQDHYGVIYQAMNWVYVGASQAQREVMYRGKIMHKRVANLTFGTIKGMQKSPVLWKHKYLYPLDTAMREQIKPLSKSYPKRAASIDSDAAGHQPADGGARPTAALQAEV